MMEGKVEEKIFSNFIDRVEAVIEILLCEWSDRDDIRALPVKFDKAFSHRDIGDWIEETVLAWQESDMIEEEPIDEGEFLIPDYEE